MHYASSLHRSEMLKRILETLGAVCKPIEILELQDTSGSTPLHYACKMASLESVKCILENTDDCSSLPNFIGTQDANGNTSLHVAGMFGNKNKVQAILSVLPRNHLKRILNVSSIFGKRAIDVAADEGNMAVMEALNSQTLIAVEPLEGKGKR